MSKKGLTMKEKKEIRQAIAAKRNQQEKEEQLKSSAIVHPKNQEDVLRNDAILLARLADVRRKNRLPPVSYVLGSKLYIEKNE